MSDPLKPDLTLLTKLGSIAVHVEEMMSSDGHDFDRIALKVLLDDNDVNEWLTEMGAMALLPLRRRA